MASCLYFGRVMHRRLGAVRHRFAYRVFSLLVDIDELPALDRRLRLFSHNRWNLFSLMDRDHGDRSGRALRPWIDNMLARSGIETEGGPVRLLCFPRVLGYVFMPLSIWFCHHRDGSLRAVLYEVHNTFGEAHGYLIPVAPDLPGDAPVRQRCDKAFYVSPFIGMSGSYRFRLRRPDARLAVVVRQSGADGQGLVAVQTGRRRPLTDGALLRAFVGYPLMTFKVIAAIHWEALRLWLKGAPFGARPAPPAALVTHVRPGGPGLSENA